MKSVLKKTECMLVLSLALGTPAFAQTVDSVAVAQENFKLELSLEEAKKYALEHNRTIKNASYDVQKSEAVLLVGIECVKFEIGAVREGWLEVRISVRDTERVGVVLNVNEVGH